MSTPASHRDIPPPHLTVIELCRRWRIRRETISRNWRRWGLRPIRIAGSLLHPLDQIEEVERRLMVAAEIEIEDAVVAAKPKANVIKTKSKARPKPAGKRKAAAEAEAVR